MNLVFSDEQQELRRTVAAYLREKSSVEAVRHAMESEHGYDPVVWAQLSGQLGLTGLSIPEEYGGSGGSYRDLTVVLEEMGRVLLCAPYFSSVVLAASALLESCDTEAMKQWLPGIASGELTATLAWTEDAGSWDVPTISTRATSMGDCWVVDGVKSFVLDGYTANLVLVLAGTGAGASLFAVPVDCKGLTRTPLSTMDQTRKQARLEFTRVPATLVGEEGMGPAILERVLDLAATALAAEQVGGAQQVLDMAVGYAKQRLQFGRPIGSFQAIKHKCADMLMEIELARSAAYYAGWCAAESSEALPVAAAVAKSYCSEAYSHAAAENIQVHGGIGFTWEHSAHLYFKRAKSSELLFGDPTRYRSALAHRIAPDGPHRLA